jgi:hypothetical protein
MCLKMASMCFIACSCPFCLLLTLRSSGVAHSVLDGDWTHMQLLCLSKQLNYITYKTPLITHLADSHGFIHSWWCGVSISSLGPDHTGTL